MIFLCLLRLYDYANLIRNAVLTTMNETRVSLSLTGLYTHLSSCPKDSRPFLFDTGFQAPVACFLEGSTMHPHKATLFLFTVTQLYQVLHAVVFDFALQA